MDLDASSCSPVNRMLNDCKAMQHKEKQTKVQWFTSVIRGFLKVGLYEPGVLGITTSRRFSVPPYALFALVLMGL
jgi:hypothetical protein